MIFPLKNSNVSTRSPFLLPVFFQFSSLILTDQRLSQLQLLRLLCHPLEDKNSRSSKPSLLETSVQTRQSICLLHLLAARIERILQLSDWFRLIWPIKMMCGRKWRGNNIHCKDSLNQLYTHAHENARHFKMPMNYTLTCFLGLRIGKFC